MPVSLLHQTLKIRPAARVRVAVTLHQPLTARDLQRQCRIAPRQHARSAPAMPRSARCSSDIAQRPPAKTAQRGDASQQQEAADRRRLHVPSARCQPFYQPPRRTGAQQPTADRCRQRVGDLLHARMHELGDAQHLVGLYPHLGAHAGRTGWRASSGRRRGSYLHSSSTMRGGARFPPAARRRDAAGPAVRDKAGHRRHPGNRSGAARLLR